jgi:uncharacterized protein (DUF849 family)
MISRGTLAKTNAEQVTNIRRIVEDMRREVAAEHEARAKLRLKGGDATAIR